MRHSSIIRDDNGYCNGKFVKRWFLCTELATSFDWVAVRGFIQMMFIRLVSFILNKLKVILSKVIFIKYKGKYI